MTTSVTHQLQQATHTEPSAITVLSCSVLEKMPTKKDASSFGSRERIEHAFTAMGCDDDSIANFCAGTVADAVGEAVEWIGSHRAAKKEWVERYYSCTGYFGELRRHASFKRRCCL